MNFAGIHRGPRDIFLYNPVRFVISVYYMAGNLVHAVKKIFRRENRIWNYRIFTRLNLKRRKINAAFFDARRSSGFEAL